MEGWERVLFIMEQEKLNKNSMSRQIGLEQNVTIGAVIKERKNPRATTLKRIAEAFPQYNKEWVMTGKEPIMNNEKEILITNEQEIRYVPLIPISAQGGSLDSFITSMKDCDYEKITSPINNVDIAITVNDTSMAPEFPNGSIVFVQKVNEKAFIDWGKVYVLDTCNGIIMKTLTPSDQKEFIRCVSINDNPIYAPFDIKKDDIFGFYRVRLCLSFK